MARGFFLSFKALQGSTKFFQKYLSAGQVDLKFHLSAKKIHLPELRRVGPYPAVFSFRINSSWKH